MAEFRYGDLADPDPETGRTRNTIHGTHEVNVVLDGHGNVTAVWFRCMRLPFTVSAEGSGHNLYIGHGDADIKAIIFEDGT